jgi:hypothetical protein
MNGLLAIVIPLSLGAAVSPTVLGVVVLTLSCKVAPRARAWAETAGVTVGLVLVTVLVALLAQWLAKVRPNPTLIASTDIVFGVALLGLAVYTALRRTAPSARSRVNKGPADSAGAALPAFFGIGLLLLATDASSLVLYVPAMKDIAQSSLGRGAKVAVAAIPFFAVIAPALLPTALASAAPKTADRLLKPFGAWVEAHSKQITMGIEIVFGVALVLKGSGRIFHF